MSLRIRRGSDTQRQGITFDLGEPAWSSDSHKLYIGDAQTQGGINILASSAGAGLVWNHATQQIDVDGASPALTTDLVTEGSINKYFTINSAIAATAQGLQNGTQSGIGFSYDSGANTISATVNINAVLPAQSGHAGQVLSTDGSGNLSWVTGLPSQSGHGGSVLTTNGTTASWTDILINTLTNGSYNVVLDSSGNLAVSGTIKLPSTADIVRETGVGTGIYSSVLGGLSSVSADTSPSLGSSLNINNNDIFGIGNVRINGRFVSAEYSDSPSIPTVNAVFTRARGNSSSPLAVQTSDTIGTLLFSGYTGTSYAQLASITAFVSTRAPVSSSVVPGKLTFFTTAGSGVSNKILEMDSDGGSRFYQNTAGAYQIGIWSYLSAGSPSATTNFGRFTGSNYAATGPVATGDIIHALRFQGYNGSALKTGSQISSTVYNSVDSNQFQSDISLECSQPNGILIATQVNRSDRVIFNVIPILPSFSNSTDAETSVGTPLAGMMYFDSSSNQFKGYNGSGWVLLG